MHPLEFFIYALLGLLGGLVSTAFVKLLLWQRSIFLKAPQRWKPFTPAVGGLVVGLLALAAPGVLGVGYNLVSDALNGQMALKVMLLLLVLKLVATTTCYGSGNAGGIFGPSLFIGAMLGGVVGQVAHSLFPDHTGNAGAYALVGMGAAFAGIVRTPMTSVIMIFEVTRDYTIIVPLMISNLIAFYISKKLQKEPIYEALARQDGLHLPRSSSRTHSAVPLVSSAAREVPASLTPEMKISDAAERVKDSALESWPVADELGLVGMVRTRHIAHALDQGKLEMTIERLMQIARRSDTDKSVDLPHVHNDQPLSRALARMKENGHKVLPVVSRANVRIMLGIVTFADILKEFGVESADELDYRDHPDL